MLQEIKDNIYQLFDLREDTEFEKTDESIRSNSNFRSANAWTLIFAIFLASVGLNVNSPAVIIGAMLISPLMGPIVGAGYALGVNDFFLLKSTARNLLIAMVISILTSTIYFLLSPFEEAQSEILARTFPTFYDVLIAVFGGSAGIVALSRKEKSNAIPGVAIATALMPPLCTVGYGLANGNWAFVLGALYLFVLNSIFICLSTYFFVRLLRFRRVAFATKQEQMKIKRWVFYVTIAVTLPSLIMAAYLLQETTFRQKAKQFVEHEVKFKNSYIADQKFTYSWNEKKISLIVIGDRISKKEIEIIEAKKSVYNLSDAIFNVEQISIDDKVDQKMSPGSQEMDKVTSGLKGQLAILRNDLKLLQSDIENEQVILNELQLFTPELEKIFIRKENIIFVWNKKNSRKIKTQAEQFVKKRLGDSERVLIHALRD